MLGLTALDLARIQFGFTMSSHIIFPAITIGLASYLRAVAAVAAQFHRVQVGQGTDPKDTNQLMLTSVETALPCVGFYPRNQIEHGAVDTPSGGDQFLDLAPVHANKVNGAVG